MSELRTLERVLAQLRHAYHNLIGPDEAWDREQRMRFADGLIAPQIEKLEQFEAESTRIRRQLEQELRKVAVSEGQ